MEYLQVKKGKVDSSVESWFNENIFLSLLCGLKVKAAKLFPEADYEDIELELDADDDAFAGLLAKLNEDDAALVLKAKNVFDWAVFGRHNGWLQVSVKRQGSDLRKT